MNRSVLAVTALFILSLAAFLVLSDQPAGLAAQSDGGAWTSSAEAPEGTTLEQFSPADSPSAGDADSLQDEALAPQAIISWRVTGSALKPRQNDVNYTTNTSGACTYVTSGDANTVWNIPVMLPQGTEVHTLRMYFDDTSGSNSNAWFTVYDLYGAIVQEWGVASSGNTGNSFNDSAAIDHTVDYSLYSYMLNWRPVVTGASMQLCGFRIFHDPPIFGSFLPAVQNSSP